MSSWLEMNTLQHGTQRKLVQGREVRFQVSTWEGTLGATSIYILSRDPNLSRKTTFESLGKWTWFLKRAMAEKNGESTPRGA